jgi:hypothetical protein
MSDLDARVAALRETSARSGAVGRVRRAGTRIRLGRADRWVLLGLGLLFVAFVAVTWKTWGDPQTDYGVELTAADRIVHGAVLYDDIRYFYGPLGVHCLALAFAIFGTSFTTAFAFGIAVALAIFATFHILARTWLTPVFAGMATAIVMAIGFTGTFFGYVAPHTTSATFGVLAILLELLALTRGRVALAGVAAGAAILTRPELAAVALAAGAGFVVGRTLERGRGPALRDLLRLFAPALLIPLVVLAPFAIATGPRDLVFDQLIPLDFLRISGLQQQAAWAPFDLTSAVALGARGLVYVVLLGSLAAASVRWHRRPGPGALLPLLVGVGGLLALDAAAHVAGAFPGTTGVVQTEAKRLLLGMSWLPFAVAAVAVWAALRARQRRPAPISGSWPIDLALIAAALVLATRAYNRFTTDTYAAYYAPLLVLVAVILQQRIASRFPGAQPGVLIALAAVFAGLTWNAVVDSPSADDQFELHTARGTYLAPEDGGPAYQRVLDIVRRRTEPGEPVLALPLEGGLSFAVDRPPALRELQFHPGVLDSRADERQAISILKSDGVRLVVEGNTRFDAWGLPVIGVDYNRLLMHYVKTTYTKVTAVGDYAHTSADAIVPRAYRIYELPARSGAKR